MLLNKKMLLTALVVVITSGCVNKKSIEQQTQIINLQDELVTAQKNNLQTQADLTAQSEALVASKAEINELTALLAASVSKPAPVKVVPSTVDNKSTLGQSEWVYISSVKSNFKSRIDTGAATSSLNAIDIKRFERDGKKWVRFNLAHENDEKPEIIEARIIRIAKIIQSGNPGEDNTRIVVKLHVRIGDVKQTTEFTLADRLHMEYPVLIGRSFLQDIALVDVGQEYIHSKYKAK